MNWECMLWMKPLIPGTTEKNKYDYGCDFEAWWEADTTAMVERDYNHPSVILYSIGNEVAEPCEKKGLQVGSAMIECIHSHDHTRPVTVEPI